MLQSDLNEGPKKAERLNEERVGGASGARRLGLFDFRNKGAISLQLLSRWLFIACSSYSDTLRGLYFHLIDRQE